MMGNRRMPTMAGGWILVMGLVFLAYSLPSLPAAISAGLSAGEFVLYVMTEQYYIQYFLTILFCFAVFRAYRREEDIVVIRYRKFWGYYRDRLLSVAVLAGGVVLLHLLLALIMAIPLAWRNVFTGTGDELFTLYAAYFPAPLAAAAWGALYLWFGLMCIGALLIFGIHYLKRWAVAVIAIAVYMVSALGFGALYHPAAAVLFTSNWLILANGLRFTDGSILLILGPMLLLLAGSCAVVRFCWQGQLHLPGRGPSRPRRHFIFVQSLVLKKRCLILIPAGQMLLILSVMAVEGRLDFYTLLFLFFYGNGVGYIDVLALLRTLIFDGMPLYILCLFLQKEAARRSSAQIIRLGSPARWYRGLSSSAAVFIAGYVALSVGLMFLAANIFPPHQDGGELVGEYFRYAGVREAAPWLVGAGAVILKMLDLYLQFLAVMGAFSLCGNLSLVFIAMQALIVTGLSCRALSVIIPFGASALARVMVLPGCGIPVYACAGYMIVWIGALDFMLCRRGGRRLLLREI